LSVKICPRCGGIAEYNAYYGKIMCTRTNCNWEGYPENRLHKIIAIVAVDNNWAIGKNNKLLYNVPEDMKYFRNTTNGNIVIYGYNTLLSFPNKMPLPNRTNIVLYPGSLEYQGITVAHNIENAIKIINSIQDDRPVFVCGGASIYRQMIDLCHEAYVTKIDAATDGADAFFPNLDALPDWTCYDEGLSHIQSVSGFDIRFTKYVNKHLMHDWRRKTEE